jgi:hypothetical protein
MMFALCAAGLFDPASVHADTPCRDWRWDGYTELVQTNGSKLVLYSDTDEIPQNSGAEIYPPGGGQREFGFIEWGGVQGSFVYFAFRHFIGHSAVQGTEVIYEGGVPDDGFAYGTFRDDDSHTSGSWRSAAPLRCA